ncbi:MFS transporter [Vulcanisaeta thermophila]|uniref:MFS transporter n=1 Tax=Vulcanisaeta thermophila TaxID=867917 RepID=UPI0008530CFB|nr:MFS transporter [Vulcanisaeta thermophila]
MRISGGSAALIIASLSFFSIVVVRFAIPSILPYVIAREGVNEALGGLLISIFWVGYTVFQLIGGLITDRYGFTALIYVLALISALTMAYPLALTHYYYLAALQFCIGSLSAVAYVLLVSMVLVNYRRSGLGVGIYQSMFFIASSVSILLTPLFVTDYSELFVIYAATVLLALAALLVAIRRGLIREVNKTRSTLRIGPENPGFLGIGLLRFSSGFSYLGFLSWSTYYVIRTFGTPLSTSGFYAFMASILGTVGAVLGGYVGDKLGYVYPSASASGLLAMDLVILSLVRSPPVVIGVMLTLGFLYGFYASPTMATTKFARNVGATSGFLNFMSQLGGTLSPYLIGFITQLFSIYLALLIVGLTSIALVMIGLLLVSAYGFSR